MKIGDEIYVHGFVDEIRKDTVIVRNEGGYFGTIPKEIKEVKPSFPVREPIEKQISDCIWRYLADSSWDIQDWCSDNGFNIHDLNEFLNCGEYEMRHRRDLDTWATEHDTNNVK